METSPAAFIAHKRDGGEHLPAEIHLLVESFLKNDFTDYQMTAWLMAVYLRGLTPSETLALTEAMLHSGTVLEGRAEGPPRIDKHSTGGVGDKVSLALAPLVAACGVHVPMIAGRGLGHTGGTLDKLESIPGFSVSLSARRFEQVVDKAGACIMGQTKDIAPADRRIYALRDVTATVACRPLIVASIVSKKLAEGLHGLVFDVKVGRGAFMQTKKEARQLAKDLVETANALGTPSVACLSNMEAPLGRTIGNALEVWEAVEILKNEGPPDSTALSIHLAEEMLLLADPETTRAAARERARVALESGLAWERFLRMVELQGGDPRTLEDPRRLPRTRHRVRVESPRSGTVQSIDALALAEIALELGAGRVRAADAIDPAVGIELHAQVGDRVEKGQRLATLHVRTRAQADPLRVLRAIAIANKRAPALPLLLGRVTSPRTLQAL